MKNIRLFLRLLQNFVSIVLFFFPSKKAEAEKNYWEETRKKTRNLLETTAPGFGETNKQNKWKHERQEQIVHNKRFTFSQVQGDNIVYCENFRTQRH